MIPRVIRFRAAREIATPTDVTRTGVPATLGAIQRIVEAR